MSPTSAKTTKIASVDTPTTSRKTKTKRTSKKMKTNTDHHDESPIANNNPSSISSTRNKKQLPQVTGTIASASDFMVGMMIGEGSYGTIVYAKHKHSQMDVAVKVVEKVSLRKNYTTALRVKQEQMILKQLKQPQQYQQNHYVIDLLASFHDPECVYLVMECCTGGTLSNVIKMLHNSNDPHHNPIHTAQQTNDAICRYTYQLQQGLLYIHRNGIVHCDIKPDNILLTSNAMIKIADFGCAVDMSSPSPAATSSSKTHQPQTRGSIGYACPEFLLTTSSSSSSVTITPAVDLWSFGCICYQLVTGHVTSPFHHTNGNEASSIQLLSDYCSIVATMTAMMTNSNESFLRRIPLLFPGSISMLILDDVDNNNHDKLDMTRHQHTNRWKLMITTLLDPKPDQRYFIKNYPNSDGIIIKDNDKPNTTDGTVPSSPSICDDPFQIWDNVDVSKPPALIPPTPTWWRQIQQHNDTNDTTSPAHPMKDGKIGWSAFLLSDI